MKKLVLLAMLLPLAWGGLQAQTQDSLFSDPGFDYWETGQGQDTVTYDDLMDPFWGSLNFLARAKRRISHPGWSLLRWYSAGKAWNCSFPVLSGQ